MDTNAAKLISSSILVLAGIAAIATGSIPATTYIKKFGLRPMELFGVVIVALGLVTHVATLFGARRAAH